MQASSSNGVSSTPPRRFGVQRIAQICRLPQGLGEQRQQCRGSSTHSGERTWRRAPPAFTGSRRAACGLTAGGARQGSRLAAGGARQGSRPTPGGGRRRPPWTSGAPPVASPPAGRTKEAALQRRRQRPAPKPYPASTAARRKRKGAQGESKAPSTLWRAPPGPTAREGGAARHSAERGGVHRGGARAA